MLQDFETKMRKSVNNNLENEFGAIAEIPDKENVSQMFSSFLGQEGITAHEFEDDQEISGLEEPDFQDYEDRIEIQSENDLRKEQMMDGMRIFDLNGLEHFHNYNLNVETGKRLALNEEALQAAISSSDEDEDGEQADDKI